ncbi:MAG: metal ABC transporter permease, partial [Phycisphaerales bacterium]|nr:metal ABC transporter permease [Phycisphaerales bacterium]
YNTAVVVVGATLLGLASGVVGAFTTLRKRALMGDALSHASLPGVVSAFLIAACLGLHERSVPILLAGAALSAVLGAVAVQWITRATRLQEDAAIGAVLSVFFGAGIVLLSVAQALPGVSQGGIRSYIYGQTAAMSVADARTMAAAAALATAAAVLLHKEFTLACFDPEFARAQGWSVGVIDLMLMALLVAVAVIGMQAVGLLLMVAMLIIPAAAARFWTDRLGAMVWLSAALGAAGGYLGACASALASRLPAGAVIVLTSGALFALSMLLAPRRGMLAEALRRARLRLRIRADHALETLIVAEQSRAMAEPERIGPALRMWLSAQSLAEWSGGRPTLTDKGRERGLRVRRNHMLWSRYLTEHADVAPSHVDWTADQVEHVLGPETTARLERLLAADERAGGAHA